MRGMKVNIGVILKTQSMFSPNAEDNVTVAGTIKWDVCLDHLLTLVLNQSNGARSRLQTSSFSGAQAGGSYTAAMQMFQLGLEPEPRL